MNIGPAWTDTRVDILKRMHADGFSAAKIAKELGVTRNTVCGKVARMGLIRVGTQSQKLMLRPVSVTPVRTERIPYKPPPAKRMVVRPGRKATYGGEVEMVDLPEITDLPPDTSPDACTIAGLTDWMCRWPLSEPAHDMLYCGAASFGPWCQRHRRIVFISMETRRRR